MKSRAGRWKGVLIGGLALFSGCAAMTPTPIVHQPMSARPPAPPPAPPANGAIYQAGYNDRPLFEDRRARHVGDTLTIVLNEKTSASNNASSNAQKTGSIDFSVPTVLGLPGKSFQGAQLQTSSDNKFDGKGGSAADNAFTGTITVTVTDVLENGNLLVSGEKRIALNQGEEYIRFSGVVNPTTIAPGNTVSSVQVADARIEYQGKGYIQEAQVMGWLARFFLSFLPF